MARKENLSGLSEWMASTTDFFVIRRFRNLNARIILKLQVEISDLESQLSFRDHRPGSEPWTFLDDTCEERKTHLETLQEKLCYYSEKNPPTIIADYCLDGTRLIHYHICADTGSR